MRTRIFLGTCAVMVAGLAAAGRPAFAGAASSYFSASLTIEASCQIASADNLDFGTQPNLNGDVDAQSALALRCTNATPYNVGLNAGSSAGGTASTRQMTNGVASIAYKIFSDSGHATNWGNTVGTDSVAGTGNGGLQNITIYGRVVPQATPASASYSDTLTVTVTY